MLPATRVSVSPWSGGRGGRAFPHPARVTSGPHHQPAAALPGSPSSKQGSCPRPVPEPSSSTCSLARTAPAGDGAGQEASGCAPSPPAPDLALIFALPPTTPRPPVLARCAAHPCTARPERLTRAICRGSASKPNVSGGFEGHRAGTELYFHTSVFSHRDTGIAEAGRRSTRLQEGCGCCTQGPHLSKGEVGRVPGGDRRW